MRQHRVHSTNCTGPLEGVSPLADTLPPTALVPAWELRPKTVMAHSDLIFRRETHRYPVHFSSAGASDRVPQRLRRFFAQRYALFSRFDRGVRLDDEMWYSVTPELIAREQALRVARCTSACGGVLIDAFCGAGGNAIQFAVVASQKRSLFVLGFDVDGARLLDAQRNAEIYGASGRLDFIRADFRSAPRLLRTASQRDAVAGVFLSPPWADSGAVSRAPAGASDAFSVRSLGAGLDGALVLAAAATLSREVALFLPWRTRLHEVRALAAGVGSSVLVQEHVRAFRSGDAQHATGLTCYFGDWAKPCREEVHPPHSTRCGRGHGSGIFGPRSARAKAR